MRLTLFKHTNCALTCSLRCLLVEHFTLDATTARHSYATEASTTGSSGKLLVNLVAPHQALLSKFEARQVNLSSSDGDMGILASHVPTIAQLKPGVIEVFGNEKTIKYFVSGGFAVVNPDSSLNINAVEAVSVTDLDFEAAKRSVEDATKRLSSGTEEERVEAKIQLEVFEAVVAAAKHA
ncbi:ATP synthase F1, epsilon subunit [Batrachochytrium salamandrivorans]|nr:ATP synthase F1, epsilon subunit [Batrachochytrium salamandrivorans]